jgi:hypothetical protein
MEYWQLASEWPALVPARGPALLWLIANPNRGILLRPDGAAATGRSLKPARALVFSTLYGDEILAQLAGRGVSVDREVAQLRRSDLS